MQASSSSSPIKGSYYINIYYIYVFYLLVFYSSSPPAPPHTRRSQSQVFNFFSIFARIGRFYFLILYDLCDSSLYDDLTSHLHYIYAKITHNYVQLPSYYNNTTIENAHTTPSHTHTHFDTLTIDI